MIQVVRQGNYTIRGTQQQTRILILDQKQFYSWITIEEIMYISAIAEKRQLIDSVITKGTYRLYRLKDEPGLTNTEHLELLVRTGTWQGYLLPRGLPDAQQTRHEIIPTSETVTRSSHHRLSLDHFLSFHQR